MLLCSGQEGQGAARVDPDRDAGMLKGISLLRELGLPSCLCSHSSKQCKFQRTGTSCFIYSLANHAGAFIFDKDRMHDAYQISCIRIVWLKISSEKAGPALVVIILRNPWLVCSRGSFLSLQNSPSTLFLFTAPTVLLNQVLHINS